MTTAHEDLLYPTLTDEQIEILSHKGQEVCFTNGETIFAEGNPADNIYIVLEGQIRVTRKVGVEENLIAIHEPGQFTGELSLLTGGLSKIISS